MSESIREPAEYEVSPQGVVAAIEAEIQECGGADRYLKSLQLEPAYDPALDYVSNIAAIIDSASDESCVNISSPGEVFYSGALLGVDIACRVLSEKRMPALAEEIDEVFKGIVEESLLEDAEDLKEAVMDVHRLLIHDVVPYIDLLKQYEEELFLDSSFYSYAHSGMAVVLLAMSRVMSKIADQLFEERINREVATFAAGLDDELDKLLGWK